ncbi:MAG: metal-dependent hydrolase [Pseudomonadales bacterium]
MPSVFTHSLVGVCLAPLVPKAVPRKRLLFALVILPIVPDLDVVTFQLGISYSDPLGHRGFTHSIAFALLAAALATWFVCPGRSAVRDRLLVYAVLFFATISHGILDAFTDAGLGVGFLIPFDDARYFAPWRPIMTSPLSIGAFFDGPALRILANEFVYIGVPSLLFLTSILALRRRYRIDG